MGRNGEGGRIGAPWDHGEIDDRYLSSSDCLTAFESRANYDTEYESLTGNNVAFGGSWGGHLGGLGGKSWSG